MEKIIIENRSKVTAIGECGLDYDRLEHSSKEAQLKHFPLHFDLAAKYQLPMYLHSRNCEEDFIRIVRENRHKFKDACVHSYTGSMKEL
jgi:TatD DNase family protein